MHGGISYKWIEALKNDCDKVGIEFMASAFSPTEVKSIDPLVKVHKIASCELTSVPILKAVNECKKPVLLSTAASASNKDVDEIKVALEYLNDCEVIPMYCVGNYPARKVDLRNISTLKKIFKRDIGYSDHSIDVLNVPTMAVKQGAVIIEKHFKIHDMDTPDSPHSLNPSDFKLMVRAINDDLPEPRIGWIDEEQEMVLRHRRRLVAIKDISTGDRLVAGDNYDALRVKHDDPIGLHGFLMDRIDGKTAKVDVEAFKGIPPGII